MKRIILFIMMFLYVFQTISFAQTEFVYGNAPRIEESRIETKNDFFLATIFNVNGVPYIYKGSKTNPVPYDESLSEIFDKNYIICYYYLVDKYFYLLNYLYFHHHYHKNRYEHSLRPI